MKRNTGIPLAFDSRFFFAMAGLNEVVWRSFTTDQWVNFKVFGLLPITLVFALANAPFMAKHMQDDEAKT